MADFNFDASVNAQDQTGASRGYTSSKVALAGLFENVGNLTMAGVKVADQNNLQNQKQMAEEGVSNILNDFGFRTEGNDTTGTPAEIQSYAKQLQQVHKAYLSGSLKESNFQIRIDALSRKIRSQYPGYSDEIDTIISQTLNRSTANDVRKMLAQEWDQEIAGADADEKKYQSELTDWREKGLYQEFPNFEHRQASGNPYSKEEVRLKMGKRLSREHEISVAKDELALAESQGKLTKTKVEETALSEASLVASDIIRTSTNGTDLNAVMKKLISTPVKDWNDQQTGEILGAYAQLEAKARIQIMTRLNDKAYLTLSKDVRDEVIKRAMEPLSILKEALTQKDVGLINIFKTLTDTQTSKDAATYLGVVGTGNAAMAEVARKQRVVETMFGPEAKAAIQMNPDYQSDQNALIASLMKMDLAEGKPLDQIVQDGNKTGTKEGSAERTRDVVSTSVKLLASPTTRPEGKAALVESMFGEGNAKFLEKFSSQTSRPDGRSERMQLFEKMYSPEVTRAVLEASKTDPTLIMKYKDSLGSAFTSLFQSDISNIRNARVYSDLMDFTYNPNTNQFEAKYKPGKSMPVGGGIFPNNEVWKVSEGKQSMDKLNRYILQLKPAMDGLGLDSQKALFELMESNKVFDQAPQGSLWSRLGNALMSIEPNIQGSTKDMEPGRTRRATAADLIYPENIFNDQTRDDSKRKQLLDFIGVAEGADYDTLYGGAKMPLTKMTIDEASMMADYNRAKGGAKYSTAIGKYQIIQETLKRAMKGVGLTGSDLFSSENQDKLANWIIDNEAGGGKDAAKLSAVWASLPKDASGAGTYDDDKNGNRARVSWEDLSMVLQ